MKSQKPMAIALSFALLSSLPAAALTLEDWQFDDAAATSLPNLAKATGSAAFAGAATNVTTDGAGNLTFSQGVDASDNVFRNATLTSPNITTGKYEISFTYTSATIAGGDDTGANVGFGIRDDLGDNTFLDLFLVRLQRQNGTLRLQHRVGSTNTDLEDFGVTSISDLQVRVIADFDSDTFEVHWKLGGGQGKCSTHIPMSAPNLEFDIIRLTSNTNTTDWGATDQVKVDFLRVATFTDEPSHPAIEDWQFNTPGNSFNNVVNDAGTANLGGAAANVITNGSGQLVFSQGMDAIQPDNVFRVSEISAPNQTTGRFEMEFVITAATLTGDGTGANVGFGMRDTTTNSDLLVVRLHLLSNKLRLQSQATTTTTLENFNVDTLSGPLHVRVVADLDTDTFSVHWRLNGGIGSCLEDIPMSAPNLEFDAVRTIANTNNTDWGATDTVSVDYLTLRDLNVVEALSLTIAAGPGANEVTLIWPTSTPASAILEASTDLMAPWDEITDTPSVNGANNELIINKGINTRNFFRLRTP